MSATPSPPPSSAPPSRWGSSELGAPPPLPSGGAHGIDHRPAGYAWHGALPLSQQQAISILTHTHARAHTHTHTHTHTPPYYTPQAAGRHRRRRDGLRQDRRVRHPHARLHPAAAAHGRDQLGAPASNAWGFRPHRPRGVWGAAKAWQKPRRFSGFGGFCLRVAGPRGRPQGSPAPCGSRRWTRPTRCGPTWLISLPQLHHIGTFWGLCRAKRGLLRAHIPDKPQSKPPHPPPHPPPTRPPGGRALRRRAGAHARAGAAGARGARGVLLGGVAALCVFGRVL
jgi:hypothetical protein